MFTVVSLGQAARHGNFTRVAERIRLRDDRPRFDYLGKSALRDAALHGSHAHGGSATRRLPPTITDIYGAFNANGAKLLALFRSDTNVVAQRPLTGKDW
ncbi:MAG: hypothetical protein ACO1SX_21200 [Actinomycetota bacterium]